MTQTSTTPTSAETVIPYPDVHPAERRKRAILAGVVPGVAVRHELGEHGTLLSIDKARRVLGFAPQHSWRDHV